MLLSHLLVYSAFTWQTTIFNMSLMIGVWKQIIMKKISRQITILYLYTIFRTLQHQLYILHFIGSQAESWTAVLLFFYLSLGTPPTLMQAVAWDEFVVPLVIATLHSTQMFACKHSLPNDCVMFDSFLNHVQLLLYE